MKHHQAFLNAKDDDGTTALTAASEKCRMEVIGELLKNNTVDVNARNDNGATALLVASDLGHVEFVRKLLTRNCDLLNQATSDVADDEESGLPAINHLDATAATDVGRSDLRTVRDDGRMEDVPYLQSSTHLKVDVNAEREDGVTALILASCNGHLKAVAELLNNKEVDVNAVNSEGTTALISASGSVHFEVVGELLKHAVPRDLKTNDGNAEVGLANGKGDAEIFDWDLLGSELVDVQLLKGVDSTKRRAANVDENSEAARLSVKRRKVDVNATKDDGAARLSVKHRKVDVNAKNDDGATTLIVASRNGQVNVVYEMLKSKEVDGDAKTVAGETCAMMSMQNGHADVVNALQQEENADESQGIEC